MLFWVVSSQDIAASGGDLDHEDQSMMLNVEVVPHESAGDTNAPVALRASGPGHH